MARIQQQQASVGIVIGLRHETLPAVLLQERSRGDSYAGACQVTAHGKLTDEEIKLDESTALSTALGRELREEIGEVATQMIEASLASAVELERCVNAKGQLVVTLGLDLAYEASLFQKLIVPGGDVGGFRICTDPSVIRPLEDSHKQSGVSPAETRMFPDEIRAVQGFFSRIFRINTEEAA